MQMLQPLDEIMSIVASKGKISLDDLEKVFRFPSSSTRSIVEFLLKFGFVKMVEGNYLILSEVSQPFFEEFA